MSQIAIVSVPSAMAPVVGAQLSRGLVAIPSREEAEIGRTYFVTPLFTLSGTGLFDNPLVDVEYFATYAEVYAWGQSDIARRMEAQREVVRKALREGLRRKEARR